MNIINFPKSKHMESRINIIPDDICYDFEFVRNTSDTKFLLAEIALIDAKNGKFLLNTPVHPQGEYNLSKRLKERGFNRSDLEAAPTFSQIDGLLQYLLKYSNLIGWNTLSDIRNYPALKQYAHKTICCMKRYAERYGPYDFYWHQHSYLPLEDTSIERGFVLEDGDMFHTAATDAKACAYLWNWLNEQEKPSQSGSDLLLRSEVEKQIKEISETDEIPF